MLAPGALPAPGLLRRLAAMLYDALLLLAVLFLATLLALPFNAGQAYSSGQYLFPLYLLLVCFLFYGWFWTHGGQTLGLKSWRMRLAGFDGGHVGWSRAGLRFVAALLSWLCLGAGVLWCVVDRNGLCWHDYLSGTRLYRTH